MRNRDVLFSDRRDAGRQLAARLLAMGLTRPVVLALPRGGIPVAFEIARALGAPLGIVLVRKIGTPWSKEVAIGALAEVRRQHRVMSPSARQYAGAWLDEQIQVLQQE
ncbi:MAG TPA: phosphoribosyltransferase, partial [Noviherbaspirillum sp.]|nr:phosphoribosyltransferase [Noviherbaspirillum sp.]